MRIPMIPGGNLDAYLSAISAFPVISANDEHALALRLSETQDVNAAWQLVMSQLRFVVHLAKGYSGYGLPLADLIQEGNVGLMKAVKRYKPEFENRLVTFAVHYIKAELNEYVLRNWRMVRVATTKSQRKLFFNLRRQKKTHNWLSQDEVAFVASSLGVDVRDVREMESRLAGNDTSFDPGCDDDDSTAFQSPSAYLEDSRWDPAVLYETSAANDQSTDNLHEALAGLDERSRDILHQRWLNEEKATLHDLAGKYNVSAERIRQLEKNAMAKVRSAISIAA